MASHQTRASYYAPNHHRAFSVSRQSMHRPSRNEGGHFFIIYRPTTFRLAVAHQYNFDSRMSDGKRGMMSKLNCGRDDEVCASIGLKLVTFDDNRTKNKWLKFGGHSLLRLAKNAESHVGMEHT